jgi:hypothetical protein
MIRLIGLTVLGVIALSTQVMAQIAKSGRSIQTQVSASDGMEPTLSGGACLPVGEVAMVAGNETVSH